MKAIVKNFLIIFDILLLPFMWMSVLQIFGWESAITATYQNGLWLTMILPVLSLRILLIPYIACIVLFALSAVILFRQYRQKQGIKQDLIFFGISGFLYLLGLFSLESVLYATMGI